MLFIHPRLNIAMAAVFSLNFLLFIGKSNAAKVLYTSNGTAIAQSPSSHLSFDFVPPKDSGQPRTNRAGGRRDQLCNSDAPGPSLTLLMPPTHQGLTTEDHPVVFAYLPSTSAQQSFLTVEDENNNDIFHATVPLPDGPGIVSFALPETSPVLEAEKSYRISLALICGSALDPSDPVVEGWITRVESDEVYPYQLAQDASLSLGAYFASHGIWFDALAILADLRHSDPDNAEAIAAWEELLQSVGLDPVQDVPLLRTELSNEQ